MGLPHEQGRPTVIKPADTTHRMAELNPAHSQRVKSPPPIMSLTDSQRRYNPKRSKDEQSLGAEQQSHCGRYRATPCRRVVRRVSEWWIAWDRGTCSAGRGLGPL